MKLKKNRNCVGIFFNKVNFLNNENTTIFRIIKNPMSYLNRNVDTHLPHFLSKVYLVLTVGTPKQIRYKL